MIPAYKMVLYTTFGSSLYMMGRLVLVRTTTIWHITAALTYWIGPQDLVRQELSSPEEMRLTTCELQSGEVFSGPQCTNSHQSLSQWHRFPL